MRHIPVLLEEVIEQLDPKPGQRFIDATISDGGHSLAIAERIIPHGKILGIEWDPEIFNNLKTKIGNSDFNENFILINDSYVNLKNIAEENDFSNVDGVIFDLGMSSWHLEESSRGFSFQKDEPLNMRFNPHSDRTGLTEGHPEVTAEEIINRYESADLAKILKEYGEEGFARQIASAIVEARKKNPIKTTFQLVEIIKNALPFWYRKRKIHFATLTFQALRIAVNNELENIKTGLGQAEQLLAKGGRSAVISFHSLEDRIVKNFFQERSAAGRVKRSKYSKEIMPEPTGLKIITKKPIMAGAVELANNPRARSAKLRIAEKL